MPERYRAMVVLTAGSGLRQGEAFGVTTSRIGFLTRELRVDRQVISSESHGPSLVDRTKTPASVRTVPLPEVVVEALAAHLAAFPQTNPDAPIFTTPLGKPLRRSNFNDVWKAACKAAGVPITREYGYHSLRHYYASQLIAQGLNPKIVQARLGHSSITETMDTYGHLFPEAEDATRAAASVALSGLNVSSADLMLTSDGLGG